MKKKCKMSTYPDILVGRGFGNPCPGADPRDVLGTGANVLLPVDKFHVVVNGRGGDLGVGELPVFQAHFIVANGPF